MMIRMLGLACLLPASVAIGHHSVAAYFDQTRVLEVRGEITSVKWRNPHVGFTLKVRNDEGQDVVWDIASTSLSHISRFDLAVDELTVGDVVTVAGSPSHRDSNALYATNVLLPGNREVVLRTSGERFWSDGSDDRISIAEIEARDDADPDRSMFLVWSTVSGDPNQDAIWEASYPLTDSARAAQASWDPIGNNPLAGCEQKGMPGIMNPPYPMALVDQGDVILYRQEEFDTVRTIYMDADSAPAEPDPSIMGHSVGRWEGATLVVETTHVSWPFFDGTGIPQSEDVELEERFTMSADGKRLNYTILVTDPSTFTEPVLLDRFWMWRPEIQIEPYNCTL